jgi:PAS domain S-box-containing protein
MHQSQFHSNEDADHYVKVFKEHVQRGKGVIVEDVIVCQKNGQKIPTEVSASVKNFRGKKIIQGIFRDITERKKAERAIQESKDFLESVIENSRDGIAITDARGNILSVNNALIHMCAFSKEELVGQHSSVLTIDDKEMRKSILTKTGELYEKGFTFYEAKHKTREGGDIDVECNNAMIKDREGNYIAGVSIVRDITKRKAEEEKLINYQRQLKSLTSELIISEQKERQYFADFLHDEIGQQLFATRLQLEQLKGSLSSVENCKTLEKALHNLYQIMNQSRSLTTELSSPILKQLGLAKALEWLAEQAYKKYDIVVSFEDDKQEKPLDDYVKTLLYQSVSELLTNVAKHAKTKQASISIKKDNSNVRVCIEDDGVGFPYPSEDSSTVKTEGFGLFRIKERLEPLGGQLEIESKANRGTNITIVVPLYSNFEEQ